MGFGDKFKDLAKQAQDAVAERKEQITEAVDHASVLADQRTGGTYTDKISKFGQKAEQVVDKLATSDPATAGEPPAFEDATAGEPPAAEQPPAELKPLSFD